MRKNVILIMLLMVMGQAFAMAGIKKANTIKLYPVSVEGKWGFIDNTGKLVVQPRFQEIDNTYGFSEGMIGVKENDKWGFMNDKGEVVVNPQFHKIHSFHDGLAGFTESDGKSYLDFGGKRGYINKEGKIIVPATYDEPFIAESDFSEGMCLIEKNQKYGYINKEGKELIEPKYIWGTAFSDGVASAQNPDSSYNIIDMKGKIIAGGFMKMTNFSNGIAIGQKDGVYGLIRKDGSFTALPDFTVDFFFYLECKNGVLVVSQNEKFGLANNNGKLIVDLKYDKINSFSEGYAAASVGGTADGKGWLKTITGGWGFLDEKGNVAIPMSFESVGYFSEGLAAAQKDDLWGFINNKGAWVIDPKFKEMPGGFKNGIASITIKKGDGWNAPKATGYINRSGQYVWEPRM